MFPTLLPQITFLALVLASLTSASPTIVRPLSTSMVKSTNLNSIYGSQLARDDDLITFCFSEDDCFQASAVPAGCVDLPLFSTPFASASLSASGLECILSPERECVGGTGILFDSTPTVELSTLGLSTVASFTCTSDADLLTLCFPDTTDGCFQATTITSGCTNAPEFSTAFSTVSSTAATQCTVFEQVLCYHRDSDCAGASAVIDDASMTVDLSSLGLSTVASWRTHFLIKLYHPISESDVYLKLSLLPRDAKDQTKGVRGRTLVGVTRKLFAVVPDDLFTNSGPTSSLSKAVAELCFGFSETAESAHLPQGQRRNGGYTDGPNSKWGAPTNCTVHTEKFLECVWPPE
ncbi:hypothetical protein K438DRAFT_1754070 [Mycena galopus ATCC 62051]|nr:hypothetical protein K438DRAFT_1754070 [Mycena galopus ATCC 62051]